jgi:hypothetical protein
MSKSNPKPNTTSIARDPRTTQEWQEAVNAAYLMRIVADCVMYGLILGPEVAVSRCDELLERGKALGIEPSPDVVADPVAHLRTIFQ